ncbi:hypothetical protein TSOC_011775, partial [Tetrabaena socialis]
PPPRTPPHPQLDAPAWVLPTGALSLALSVASFIGASVENASLSLAWRTARAASTLTLLTDANGFASTTLDLGQLPTANRTTAGDVLVLEAEWIGPTRERITQTATVTLSHIVHGTSETDGPSASGRSAADNAPDRMPSTDEAQTDRLRAAAKLMSVTALVYHLAYSGSAARAEDRPWKPRRHHRRMAVATNTATSARALPAPAAGAAAPPRASSNFLVTPLFATATANADGRAVVTFTAPENLGTFVIRAYAAAGSSARYGSAETKLAVRRRLSLTPSVPRFARVGDFFEAGAVVTVGSLPATVTLTAAVRAGGAAAGAASPLLLLGAASRTVTFRAGGPLQQEVRFNFSAASIGPANLTLEATDGVVGGGRDALQLSIPVQGQQGDVAVATSFVLTALPGAGAGTVQSQEGMQLPAAVAGSGGLTLVAGVGFLPAIASMYDTLLQTEQASARFWPAGAAAAAVRNANRGVEVTVYGVDRAFLDLLPYPLPQPQQEVLLRLAVDMQAVGTEAYRVAPGAVRAVYDRLMARTDIPLNTWALMLTDLHASALSASTPGALARYAPLWAALRGGPGGGGQAAVWRSAVARQLVSDVMLQRSLGAEPYKDFNTIARVRLVLGAGWDPRTAGATDIVIRDLSLGAMITTYGNERAAWTLQETRPSVVTFSYPALRAGTSSVTITAVAATAGSFVLPPARAFAEQQPELMGMTAASSLAVCAACSGPSYATTLPAAPKPCAKSCTSRVGTCNVATGVCLCNSGVSPGANCQKK